MQDADKSQLKVEVDPALHRACKVLAASNGTTMTDLVTRLLVEELRVLTDQHVARSTPTSDALQSSE